MARLGGLSGRAYGVDASATMIAEAKRRAAASRQSAGFVQMDAQHPALPDARFDGDRAERLSQHVPDPDTALAELVSIAKPGARIVIWEADLDLFVLDAPDTATSRAMQRFIGDGFRHGRIGRELYRRFQDRGLTDVRSSPLTHELTDLAHVQNAFDLRHATRRAVAAGVVTPRRAADWLASLTAADETGRFFGAVGGFLAFGRKPH